MKCTLTQRTIECRGNHALLYTFALNLGEKGGDLYKEKGWIDFLAFGHNNVQPVRLKAPGALMRKSSLLTIAV